MSRLGAFWSLVMFIVVVPAAAGQVSAPKSASVSEDRTRVSTREDEVRFPTVSRYQQHRVVANDIQDPTPVCDPADETCGGGASYTGACVNYRRCDFIAKNCDVGTTGCASTYNSCKSCTFF